MYIVAIGWLYVAVLMALSEPTLFSGIFTLVVYGLMPVGLVLWIGGSKMRRQRRSFANQAAHQRDGSDAQADQ